MGSVMIFWTNIIPVPENLNAELIAYWKALIGDDMTGPMKALIKLRMDEAGVSPIKWGWTAGSKNSIDLLVHGRTETIRCTKKFHGETDEKRARRIAEIAVAVLGGRA